ncbi:DciA family protein [Uliginosibacterium gangwonense]|uniref:DciA family protein n=1 Tax=Uliginosibacterium gangwonense TaxID=392736 RepID=UPI00037EA0D0|nr:DciA family protein [Uliginosibacterium gangwonense]
MASTPLKKILGASEPLARLQDHAARLLRLQRIVSRAVPQVMRNLVQVANVQDGVLYLHVPSPALATRLKLSQETLRGALMNDGMPIVEIKIKVRVERHAPPPTPPRRSITPTGRDALRQLRESMSPDDPLAQALKHMEDKSR